MVSLSRVAWEQADGMLRKERILHFEPSWFTICMATGTVSQILVNFPYPIDGGPYWMRNLGYCFWILDIVLFCLFLGMITTRYVWYPQLFKKDILGFPNSSYFGAIPISLDTIVVGIISYYNYQSSARWTAFAFYWIAVVLSLATSFALLIVQMIAHEEHDLSDVAGLWLMTSVPLVVTAAAGSTLLPYIDIESTKCAIAVLIVSFICWSLGLIQVHLILAVYFWRLIAHKLPNQKLLSSGAIPLAPLGQGAYAALQMSIYLSKYLHHDRFAPTQSQPPPLPTTVLDSAAEAIHWFGIITSLFLLAHATFWLVQLVSAVSYSAPKHFNIAMWSFVYPLGSYSNGWSDTSRDLRNSGMRGWAATLTVATIIMWLFCALMTTYLGFWEGSLFSAPGLEEWIVDEGEGGDGGEKIEGRTDSYNGTYVIDSSDTEEKDQERGESTGQSSSVMLPR